MKIDSVNHVQFQSKIRIRPQLLEALDYNGGGFELCVQLKKLERNGNKDLVILAPNKEYSANNNKFIMEVIEKKDNTFYVNQPFEEANIHNITIDKYGNAKWEDGIAYNLDDMYKKAKQNMIKVSEDFNSFLRSYFKYL